MELKWNIIIFLKNFSLQKSNYITQSVGVIKIFNLQVKYCIFYRSI
jgi:hypothetical protein